MSIKHERRRRNGRANFHFDCMYSSDYSNARKINGDVGTVDDPRTRTLSGLLLPSLSAPSLCVVSGLLLVMVHGINFLDSNGRGRIPHAARYPGDSIGIERGREPQISLLALPLPPTALLYPLLFLAVLLSLLAVQYHKLKGILANTSPVPGIKTVPNAHPYMGHYSQLLDFKHQHIVFKDHSTASGISAFWGPGLKRCASVLLAEHARVILRHNSRRDFNEWIIRHGKKTLGEDSLILIDGGERWKRVRKVVARAFTNRIVKNGRKVVTECALECVDWLRRACEAGEKSNRDGSEENSLSCQGHQVNEAGKGTVCVEAEDFFKLYSLNVFGRMAMGYDFQCIPTGEDCIRSDSNGNDGRSCGHKERSPDCCTCVALPPAAMAFESLEKDIGLRSSPTSFVIPAMQLYWIPTKFNRAYRRNTELVNGLMGNIIGQELEAQLARIQNKDDEIHDGGDSPDSSERSDGGRSENMLAHLVESCTEQHFSRSPSSHECPFASSSDTATSGNSPASASPIPPASHVSQGDKATIINDATKVLHTLLTAGYGTTAISLSYVMYCLSRNPRCQERCHEEALRVLGKGKNCGNGSPSGENGTGEAPVINDDDLPYCRAVLTETTRLHLPIMFTTRVLSKDLTLDTGDVGNERATLLKGTRVIINPLMIHLDERNFERAAEFIPERWVRWDDARGRWVERDHEGESQAGTRPKNDGLPPTASEYAAEHEAAERISAANPANYFSFSDGARNCVGKRLAVMESTILIAALVRDMRVSFGVEDYELAKERSFVTVRPTSLPILVTKR